jgi:hypothetical protein
LFEVAFETERERIVRRFEIWKEYSSTQCPNAMQWKSKSKRKEYREKETKRAQKQVQILKARVVRVGVRGKASERVSE